MKRTVVEWLLVAVVMLGGGADLALGDLRIPEGQDSAVVFAGRESAIEIRLMNDAAEASSSPIDYRVFQVANRVLAPMGERKPWKEVSLLAGQTGIERLQIHLPELRAVSLFRVVFYDGEQELGRCAVIGVPPRLLAEFDSPVAVYGDSGFTAAFKELGMKTRTLGEVDEATVVLLQAGSDESAGEARRQAKDLAAKGISTVLLMPAREFARAEGGALQSLTGVIAVGEGRLLIAKQLDFSELASSAEAQLRLHQLLSLALGAEAFPWLE
ncbi:MAG: hypothetical protein ACO1QR_15575 [Chthoniobacteraceae bacterium]